MTDDRTIRDRLSDTHQPASSSRRERSSCQDCEVHEEFVRWRQRVDERLLEGDGEMNALAAGITELHAEVRHSRQSSADTSLEVFKQLGAVSTQLGNLNQRIGSMLEVAAADRSRRDIFHKTPGRPELKFGPASLKGSPWLIVAIVFVVATISIPTASWVYVEIRKVSAPAKP